MDTRNSMGVLTMKREYEVTVEFTRTETYLVLAESKQELMQRYRSHLVLPDKDGTWIKDGEPFVSKIRIRVSRRNEYLGEPDA
jgi:hypothetical protein